MTKLQIKSEKNSIIWRNFSHHGALIKEWKTDNLTELDRIINRRIGRV